MSVISAVRDYIRSYTELDDDAPVWTNYIGDGGVISYSIIPVTGERIVEEYINGSSSRAFSFAFQSVELTIDEATRMATQEFFEELAEWFRTQTEAGNFPNMDEGQTPYRIMATGWGTLIDLGQSQTGVYQISCRLEYEQSS